MKVQTEFDHKKLSNDFIDRIIPKSTPETQKATKFASDLPSKAKALRIMGKKSLEKANEFLLGIREIIDKINEAFDPIIKKAHEAHKEALAQKKKALEPALEAELYVRGKIRDVLIQIEKERKALEDARMEALLKQKKAEEERLALEQKLEEPEAEVSVETIANLDFGKPHDRSKFEMIDYESERIVATGMPKAKVGGTSLKTQWKFRILDKAKIPLDYMQVDEVKIGKVVRAAKGQISIPGVEVYEDKTLNVR